MVCLVAALAVFVVAAQLPPVAAAAPPRRSGGDGKDSLDARDGDRRNDVPSGGCSGPAE